MSKRAALYFRVSTDGQRTDSQRDDCIWDAKSRGYAEIDVFEDKASGAASRAGLDELMAQIRKGKYSVLICWKLDRLGRSLPHLAQLIAELDTHRVGLVVATQGIDTTDSNPAARMQLHVLMAVAEFERSMIRERTKAGLYSARRRGVQLGRPKGSKSLPDARRQKFERLLKESPNMTLKALCRECDISLGTASAWRKAARGVDLYNPTTN